MTRSRIIIYAAAGMGMLVVLFAVVLLLFVKPDAYRDQIEQSLADRLGMDVIFGAPIGLAVLPGLHVTLKDIHIRNQGLEIASAGKAAIGIRIFSLLRGDVSIDSITLDEVHIFVQRGQDGRFNFQQDRKDGRAETALDMDRLSISNATLRFEGQQPWKAFQAMGCNLDVRGLHASIADQTAFANRLGFGAEVHCGEIITEALALADLKISVNADKGIVVFEPIALHMLDANGTGRIDADFSGAVPRWNVQFSLPQFPIDAFFRTLSPSQHAAGSMDFSMHLQMQGNTLDEMTQTMAGQVSLSGADLTFEGIDLDEQLSRLESSRSFNLVDVGAFFIAGPVGLAVTRGYEFASLLQGSGGTSEIRALVSDWQVERGIMRAQDVAMATVRNRIALKGSLDFVHQQFDDVIVASVDANGCVTAQQKVEGTFAKPVVEQPSFLQSVAGPALKLIKQGQDLLSGDKCEVFYAGSIVAPT